MFFIEKKFRFEASHTLPKHDGKCSRLHGHSWVGTVVLAGEELQQQGAKTGMLVDFGYVSDIVDRLCEDCLDHYHLNYSTELENPTSEEIARWIFYKLKPLLPQLNWVSVEETCTCKATYVPHK